MSLQPQEISIYEALLRIESRQFLREMNATQDYSYLDTPRSSAPIRQAYWRALLRLLHTPDIETCGNSPSELHQSQFSGPQSLG